MPDLLGVFLATLIAEDASLILAAYLVAEGRVSSALAFMVCVFGIGLGDYLLYLFGRLLAWTSTRHNWKYLNRLKIRYEKRLPTKSLSALICISRFVPGTRVPVYIGAGLFSFHWFKFLFLTAISVLVWVSVALFASTEIYQWVGENWVWGTLLILLTLTALKKASSVFLDPWNRKAFPYSFEKWLYFEFWPPYLFYLPVIAWYVGLSIRHRNPLLPLYANPRIENGGMVGESKWELYQPLMTESSKHWLKTKLIPKVAGMSLVVRQVMANEGIAFPIVLKPDKGQRGYGVRIVRTEEELETYFDTFDFDVLLQEFCDWPNEAGIFYCRIPGENRGKIFSITDKHFPYIIGDGTSSLGDLILRDKRARLIAMTYFSQLRPRLDTVPAQGEKVTLSETGNHCTGAVFTNGKLLCSAMLLEKVEAMLNQVPDFYFGRFDVRYEKADTLRQGESFKVVELNGASSEATHIWDRSTPLLEAYRVLFQQWSIAFEVGRIVKRNRTASRVRIFALARESARLLLLKLSPVLL